MDTLLLLVARFHDSFSLEFPLLGTVCPIRSVFF
jgi:hypothetical protein